MSSEKKQGERLDARSKMEQSIRDYILAAQVCTPCASQHSGTP